MGLEGVRGEVTFEFLRAVRRHAPMRGPHEGWAVIREEVDELWDLVKANNATGPAGREEAIQIAAMAMRYVLDVCDPVEASSAE